MCFRHDVSADVVLSGHKEEEAADVTPEADLRLPRAEITLCRRLGRDQDGAASSVVWNPWAEKAAAMVDLGDHAWRGMVCVEAGNIADNEVRLAADGEHLMSTAIAVDARS
jgi:D-hexose-6-phosphate mutarotase